MTDDASEDGRSDPDDSRPATDEATTEPVTADSDEERGRIPIDLSGERDAGSSSVDETEGEPGDDQYAPEPRSTPIEPGAPTLENAAFVALGALLTLVVLFRLFTIVVG